MGRRLVGLAVETVWLGLGLGVAAGVSPGPLSVLVVTATLRSGLRAGLLTSAVPLLTDVLVVVLALTVLRQLPDRGLGALGVVGGLVVVAVGVRTVLDARGASVEADRALPDSWRTTLRRAFLVNILSPHPWVAWLTVLGPLAVATGRTSTLAGALFVGAFYVGIVGAKAALAVVVAGGRDRLRDTGYRRALGLAGLLLVGAGVVMLLEFGPALA